MYNSTSKKVLVITETETITKLIKVIQKESTKVTQIKKSTKVSQIIIKDIEKCNKLLKTVNRKHVSRLSTTEEYLSDNLAKNSKDDQKIKASRKWVP